MDRTKPPGAAPSRMLRGGGTRNVKAKLPRLRVPAALPSGPRMYKPVPLDEQPISSGPGQPPGGFLQPSTSLSEWYIYWGLSRLFNNPPDPRQPPFYGGWPDWGYQSALYGGRHGPGGAVADFLVYNPGSPKNTVVLRVVTEYWHLYTPNAKHASDEMQKLALSAEYTVIDVYDFDFINDPSGQETIITLKNVLGFVERPNPLWLGTSIRGSRMDMIGR